MIEVYDTLRQYHLHWSNGTWRDRAGHKWEIDNKGILKSQHGIFPVSQYCVIPLEQENPRPFNKG